MFKSHKLKRLEKIHKDLYFYTNLCSFLNDISIVSDKKFFHIEMSPVFRSELTDFIGLNIERLLKELMKYEL